MRRKAQQGMIIFIGLIFLIVIVGFLLSVGGAVVDWVWDETVPHLTNIGVVGDANMTEIASYTIAPANTFVQNLSWVVGVIYVLMLIGSIGFAATMSFTPSKWLIGFYFALVLVLILGSIFMSNIYEDFYDDNGELGARLQEQGILSFMIIYSPAILTFIAFITGIVMFSGMREEEFP